MNIDGERVLFVLRRSALCHGYTIYDMCIIFRPARAPRIFLDYKLLNAAIIFAQLTVIFFSLVNIIHGFLFRRRGGAKIHSWRTWRVLKLPAVERFEILDSAAAEKLTAQIMILSRLGEPDDLFRDLGQGSPQEGTEK